MYATTLKTLGFLTYACLIVTTPGMPSYYTFSVNTLGFTVTGVATTALLHYLITRPVQQKNLLNRLLILLIMFSFLTTIRSYLLSIPACWFNGQLKEFVNAYPRLCISFMPLKHYSLTLSSGFLAFSSGRLLLFASPATFNNIKPGLWAAIAALTCITVSVVDSVSHSIVCSITPNDYPGGLMFILKYELGILNSSRLNMSNLETGGRDDTEKKCSYFPTLIVLLLLALTLEGIKVCVAVTRQICRVRRHAKTMPGTVAKLQQKTRTPGRSRKLLRSESFPIISKPFVRNRRISLQPCGQLTEDNPNIPIEFPKTKGIQKDQKQTCPRKKMNYELRKLLSLLCMRSATFLTVFVLFATFLLSMIFIMHILNWYNSIALVVNTVIVRLGMYTLNVVLMIYDKDILEHTKNILNQFFT